MTDCPLKLPFPVFALTLALGVAACTPDPHGLSWGVRFASPDDEARAVLIEARILRGGCDGTPVYAADLMPGGPSMAMSPDELAQGLYGFAARARDADCVWFAENCVEDDLPQEVEAPIIVLLTAGPESAECAPAMCVAGRCEGELRDGGPSDSGMRMDGGRMDGGDRTDGGRDGGGTDGFVPPRDGCTSSPEVCDNRDNDCNGMVDDGFRICGDENARCTSGTCTCGSGMTYSGMRCYFTDADPQNCGTVGHACADTEYCSGGTCTCRVGLVRATSGARMGECVDRTNDPLACGSGFANCGTMGSMRSCRTTCEDACTAGQTRCDVSSATCSGCGRCVIDTNLASDPENCGGCGIACATDEVCVESACHSYFPVASCGDCEGTRTCCTYDGSRFCVSGISACPSAGPYWAP